MPITGEGSGKYLGDLQFGPGTTTRSVASLALTDGSGKFNSQIIFSLMVTVRPWCLQQHAQGITEDGAVTASLTFTIVPAPATATPKPDLFKTKPGTFFKGRPGFLKLDVLNRFEFQEITGKVSARSGITPRLIRLCPPDLNFLF